MKLKTFYKVYGKGDPIIFIHGIGSNKKVWKNVIEILLKNVALYSVASIGFLLLGYTIMYNWGDIDTHSIYADFFFQVVLFSRNASYLLRSYHFLFCLRI